MRLWVKMMSIIKKIKRKLRNLFDKAFFVLLCVVLLALFIMIKSCDLKFGVGPGNGDGTDNGQSKIDSSNDNQNEVTQQSSDSQKQVSTVTPTQSPSEPSKIAKLFLGKRGISEDQDTWYDADQFADFISRLKAHGIREVQYTELGDSIPSLEKRWAEELKKANMRSYIETDGVSLQP